MKKPKISPMLLVWFCTLGALAMAAVTLLMWYGVGYAPLLALALLQIMPAGVNLLLLLPLGRQRELTAHQEETNPRIRFLKKIWYGLKNLLCRLGNYWYTKRDGWIALLLAGLILGVNCLFWPNVRRPSVTGKLAYWVPVVLAGLFVVSVVLEKLCIHTAARQDCSGRMGAIARNLRGAMALNRIGQLLTAAGTVLTLIGLYDPHTILQILLLVLFLYESVLLVLSAAVRVIRKELTADPSFPMSVKAMGSSGVLTYLEENTGITMRSLWSVRLIRQLIPSVLLFVVVLTWLSTGIVQVESYQEGALYRCGRLQKEVLEPGLHLTLPWPFDRVEIYDTQLPKKVVVGYVPNGAQDNTWTEGHGTEEYRLLLGDGNEMVSINLMVEYRIADLYSYLRSSASAESLLTAASYEIITERTISSNIAALLAADRTVFSETFRQQLEERLTRYDTGLEVTGVVLESIHPPVEVAAIYQEVISAEIRAKELVLMAEQSAIVEKTAAQQQAIASVSLASTSHHQAIAAAQSEVAEFMASAEAYQTYPAAYRFYKQHAALLQAYEKGVIIITGVDEANLQIGNLSRDDTEDPFFSEEEVEEEYWEEETE